MQKRYQCRKGWTSRFVVNSCPVPIGVLFRVVNAPFSALQLLYLYDTAFLALCVRRVQTAALSEVRKRRERRSILQELQAISLPIMLKLTALLNKCLLANRYSATDSPALGIYSWPGFYLAINWSLSSIFTCVCSSLPGMWRDDLYLKLWYMTLNQRGQWTSPLPRQIVIRKKMKYDPWLEKSLVRWIKNNGRNILIALEPGGRTSDYKFLLV